MKTQAGISIFTIVHQLVKDRKEYRLKYLVLCFETIFPMLKHMMETQAGIYFEKCVKINNPRATWKSREAGYLISQTWRFFSIAKMTIRTRLFPFFLKRLTFSSRKLVFCVLANQIRFLQKKKIEGNFCKQPIFLCKIWIEKCDFRSNKNTVIPK